MFDIEKFVYEQKGAICMKNKESLYISAKRLCICTETMLGRLLADIGLTVSQGYLLFYICQYHPNGTFATNIHKELGLSMATVSVGAKQLRQKGFLHTEVSPEDERQKKLIPTLKSWQVTVQLSVAICQTEDAIYKSLDIGERNELYNLLQKALNKSNGPGAEKGKTSDFIE
jgi:DNA-binding MarR family transcriptional regulator